MLDTEDYITLLYLIPSKADLYSHFSVFLISVTTVECQRLLLLSECDILCSKENCINYAYIININSTYYYICI